MVGLVQNLAFFVGGKPAVKCQLSDSLVNVLSKSAGYSVWQLITENLLCNISAYILDQIDNHFILWTFNQS